MYTFLVIKAERVPYDSVGAMYVFPDEDDDLTNYAGGNAQVMVSNSLLQAIGKYIIVCCVCAYVFVCVSVYMYCA